MSAETLSKWILILVFVTAAGGITSTTVGSFGSEERCMAAGTESLTRLAADGVTVRHLCVRGE